MKLTPEQKRIFDAAFDAAFDDYAQLDKLFDHYCTTKLSKITTKNRNIDENISDIRNWASRHDKVIELINFAIEKVEGNKSLLFLKKIFNEEEKKKKKEIVIDEKIFCHLDRDDQIKAIKKLLKTNEKLFFVFAKGKYQDRPELFIERIKDEISKEYIIKISDKDFCHLKEETLTKSEEDIYDFIKTEFINTFKTIPQIYVENKKDVSLLLKLDR